MIYNSKCAVIVTLSCAMLLACDSGSGSNEPTTAPNTGSSTPNPTNSNNASGMSAATAPIVVPDLMQEGLIGPLGGSGSNGEYSQFNDSPFANLDFSSGYFFFEDFEDGVFQHPGASASNGDFATVSFGPTFHDSVDADDGMIDGNSLDGESWFYDVGRTGVIWTFDATQLDNRLPTHAGLVWTDSRGEITFEAFDSNNQSLGTLQGNHANASFNGETDEDRFYGVINLSGISAIKISSNNRLNGIEIDHLQWGAQ